MNFHKHLPNKIAEALCNDCVCHKYLVDEFWNFVAGCGPVMRLHCMQMSPRSPRIGYGLSSQMQ